MNLGPVIRLLIHLPSVIPGICQQPPEGCDGQLPLAFGLRAWDDRLAGTRAIPGRLDPSVLAALVKVRGRWPVPGPSCNRAGYVQGGYRGVGHLGLGLWVRSDVAAVGVHVDGLGPRLRNCSSQTVGR